MSSEMKNGEILSKAIMIMVLAHAGQFDKGGKPYCLHPLTVLHKLKSTDEELQAAAVLHDVIEDCSGKNIHLSTGKKVISYQMLREEGISERVIQIVKALTKVPGETLEDYKQRVFDNEDAMKIKKEDLRTNSDLRRLKGITEKDLARNAKYQMFYFEIEQRQMAYAKTRE